MLRDAQAPEGYALAADQVITLTAGANEVTVVNRIGGTVDIARYDAGGASLVGGGYCIYKDAGDGEWGQQGACVWAPEGESVATQPGLAGGDYILVDYAPQGYRSAPDQHTSSEEGVHIPVILMTDVCRLVVVTPAAAAGHR